MGIALTLRQYLDDNHIDYELMTHKRTKCAWHTAMASHVPEDALAKAVVLRREGGFVVAVVPASRRVALDAVERLLDCPVDIADEEEIGALFPDCETGAVPPIVAAYALDAIVDDSLERQPEIYLEGGDHRTLVHIHGDKFRNLMKDAPHGTIATHE
ncbi:MAG TPA: YbaK/EbsC family protein [Hyphomicrobiaceae bacterium]|nr:YbaK/EbsC family protein [Hyphomicrobiaceae bacterium]